MSSLWWTDRAALTRALAGLGVGADRPAATVEGFSGLTLLARSPAPSGHETERGLLRGPWAAGAAAPEREASPAPPPPRPFVPPFADLDRRLDALLAWLAQATGCRRPFVADRDGLPLAGETTEHDLMAIGSAITRLVQRINDRAAQPLGAGVQLELGEEQLHLVLVETELGVFTVGMLLAGPLPPGVRRLVEDGLRAALRA